MTGRTKALRLSQSRARCEGERELRRERKRYHQQRNRASATTMTTPPREEREQRPFSPCTPTAAVGVNVASPYYFKASPFEESLGVAVYDVGLVQGVYAGDDGPVFSHDGLERYGEGEDFMWPGMQSF